MRKIAGLLVAGALAGILAVKPVIGLVASAGAIRDGAWETSPGTGSTGANPYVRAAVAIAGLYALDRREALYYTAFNDDTGRALDGRCDYRIAGGELPASWWSLTLYGADNYLVANAAGIYSRHASTLQMGADHRYAIEVSAREHPGDWLPAPDHGGFSITLRLYNPAPMTDGHLSVLALPSVLREACR